MGGISAIASLSDKSDLSQLNNSRPILNQSNQNINSYSNQTNKNNNVISQYSEQGLSYNDQPNRNYSDNPKKSNSLLDQLNQLNQLNSGNQNGQ